MVRMDSIGDVYLSRNRTKEIKKMIIEIVKDILMFLWAWSLIYFMGVGVITTFFMFYRGGVIELDVRKFAGSKKEEVKDNE
tara:strand:+ start:1453 stop:1695 length:243 start_codon:yes stop_codon:yes gene_type:complete